MKRKLKPYAPADFVCDNCKGEFWSDVAYSPVPSSDQSTETYCVGCVDKRTLKKTGRVHLFSARVSKQWIKRLKAVARKQKCHYNELLEKALACYEEHHK